MGKKYRRKLTDDEAELLELKGTCERCHGKGTYCVNPYVEEMTGDQELVCLCQDCVKDICLEI